MRRVLAVLGGTALGVTMLAAPAAAAQERMQLDCGGDIGVIERTNGLSWWGVDDGAAYTTKYLRVQDTYGVFEQSYGHTGREHVVCEAAHTVDDYSSTWTVLLVRTRP
jgi:hypothetical protein